MVKRIIRNLNNYPILDFSMYFSLGNNVFIDLHNDFEVKTLILGDDAIEIICCSKLKNRIELIFYFSGINYINKIPNLGKYVDLGVFTNFCRGIISGENHFKDYLFFSIGFSEGNEFDFYCKSGSINYYKKV